MSASTPPPNASSPSSVFRSKKRSPLRSPTSDVSLGNTATIRRLSDNDVRAIFECLHHRKPIPHHLSFTIVPVGPNGLKLSPPSFEFKDGLYVLLRPERRPKNGHREPPPKPPSHLQHLMVQEHLPETCPWSLSGPQFPQPTAIQQRYCYPKGDNKEYSSRTGGALWTMYGPDKKEDLEFRLLHVYFSTKRAVNKGMSVPDSIESPPSKGVKRTKRSPLRRSSETSRSALTTTTISRSSLCSSPLSFDALPPPSPAMSQNRSSLPPFDHSNYISPPNDVFRRFHPVEDGSEESGFDFSSPGRTSDPSLNSSSGANRLLPAQTGVHLSPIQRVHGKSEDSDIRSMDNFELDVSLKDIDSYWSDPLLSIMLKPSHDILFSSSPNKNQAVQSRTLSSRLDTLQVSIREYIMQAPVEEQSRLSSVVATWASALARDPLASSMEKIAEEDDFNRSDTGAGAATAV